MPLINSAELKKVRTEKGYTQTTFAEKIKMPLSTYAYKEKIGQFDEKELEIVLKTLDISNEILQIQSGASLTVPKIAELIAKEGNGMLVELISSLKRENELLRKQNQISLDDIWEAVQVNQRILASLFENLVEDPKKNKTLGEASRKVKRKGNDVH